MRGGALDKSRYQNAPRSRFGDIRAGSSPTTFPAAFRHRNSFRDRLRDRRLCTPRARCGFCMRRRHRSHETAEISFRYVANVFEIMQRFAHRVESQPAMAPITKATIRDVSMIFPPIRFDNSSLTRVPSHRHGDRGIASPGKDFTKICRVAICGMETPAKWNYSPARLGCPAALNTT